MSTLIQPIKWHGGKHYLAKRIVDLMPPHERYLEAYAGGLSVLLAKDSDGVAEWVNDTNGELTNFWNVMASEKQFSRFVRLAKSTPLSEAAFERGRNYIYLDVCDDGDAWGAFMFFCKIRMSRQGLGKDYCTPTSRLRRGMNEQVSAWLTAVDGLPEVHERLRRVEVWNRPAVDAITRLDSLDTFFYLDPPYLHSTRSTKGEYGLHEMTPADHLELLETLAGVKGKFILSGYRSELYDGHAEVEGWYRVDWDLPNNASGAKSKERKVECVWLNYRPEVVP